LRIHEVALAAIGQTVAATSHRYHSLFHAVGRSQATEEHAARLQHAPIAL
jgi:hypothetical protein